MADLLDTLGSGLKTVGQTALAVPEAVGGTALDILIGDRENLSAGEQVKRSIESLILAGDNPANLISIHRMNAYRDAQNEEIVSSPDFKRQMEVNQVTKDLSPMDAFQYTAKQYGVHGYTPNTTTAPVMGPDLSVGPPTTGPEQEMTQTGTQTVPMLRPSSIDDLLKFGIHEYALNRLGTGSPTERELAMSDLAGLKPRLSTQLGVVHDVLADKTIPGQTTSSVNVSGAGDVTAKVQMLKGGEMHYESLADAEAAAQKYNDGHAAVGIPDRLIAIPIPSGGGILKQTTDPEATAAAGVTGKARGTVSPISPTDTRTPAEIEQQQLADKYTAQLQYERDKAALAGTVPTTVARTAAVQTVKEADQLSGMIDQYLTALKPENIGAVGDLRQLQYGIAAQNKGFANLQQGVMDSMAENNLRPGAGKGIEGITGYFDPSLSTVQVLGNTIAYRIARILDPTGKLSDADVANQKQALGLDRWFGNEQDIAARMRVMQGFAGTQKKAAQGLLGQQPVAPSRPLQTAPLGGGGGRRRVPSAAEQNLNNAFMAK